MADSDLYDDLYGDEDNEFVVHTQDPQPSADAVKTPEAQAPTPEKTQPIPTINANSPKSPISTSKPDALHCSLPAKPPSPGANGVSYSAQIAQQFSAYQQTPNQERQQRSEIPLPPNPRASTTSPVASSNDAAANSATPERPILRPSDMKDEGKMFIGGLSWDTTDEGLRNYFSEFGKVDASLIMRDPDGRSRGFAFLTFEDPSSVNAVMVREHYLDGKAIDPKRAIPREEHLRNTRYFVGGLAPHTTAESMREFFSTYGKVVDATPMVDRESGRSKGFGFVTFEDASNTDQLVGQIGLILDDKQIEVKAAQPRSQRDASRNSGGGNGRDVMFNDQESRTPPSGVGMPFLPQQPANQMSMPMLYQRAMGQVPMMGNMGMMNPMMGMGMTGFNPMANMGMMGMGGMGGMNGMGMGGMRLGMNPMASAGGIGAGGVAAAAGMNGMGMGMGMRPMGAVNPNFVRGGVNSSGPGPARMTNRGQHNFHPYAR